MIPLNRSKNSVYGLLLGAAWLFLFFYYATSPYSFLRVLSCFFVVTYCASNVYEIPWYW